MLLDIKQEMLILIIQLNKGGIVMLLNEKLYKNLSLVYVFVIIVTVMNLIIFWVWNCHVFIPFSIATVTMFSVFIKFGGMIPITIYIY